MNHCEGLIENGRCLVCGRPANNRPRNLLRWFLLLMHWT
jgi:hypothetical protein